VPPLLPQPSAFDTSDVNTKHKSTFCGIFTTQKTAWNDMKNMMENGFHGKMYGVKGGSARQFALFFREKTGEKIKFVTLDEYNQYCKLSKRQHNIDYRITRKIVHTEKPHVRGKNQKGQTRYMYPTLLELLDSSLEKIGVTPQTLGWAIP
jgi:hypothetical protein